MRAAPVLAALLAAACKRAPAPEPMAAPDTAASRVTAASTCGDGRLDPGEFCDDGNRSNDDGCTVACVRCDTTVGDARVALADGSCVSRHNGPRPWLEAHRACVDLGGTLATFPGPEKQRTVENSLLKADSARFWIGQRLHSAEVSTGWITGEPLGHESWHPESKNATGSDRDCVTLSPAGATAPAGLHTLWGLEDCANERPFVCEVTPWRRRPNGGFYRIVYRLLSWDEAGKSCAGLGAHLATITTAEEQAFLAGALFRPVWIGATDLGKVSEFHWTTREPFAFDAFAPHEPDNHDEQQHCLVLGSDDRWHDRPCTDRNVALCEID